jgi:hypothetical protein
MKFGKDKQEKIIRVVECRYYRAKAHRGASEIQGIAHKAKETKKNFGTEHQLVTQQ